MNRLQLKNIIRNTVLNKVRNHNHERSVLMKDKSLRDIIIDLLTEDYSVFVEDVKWVSPNPKMYRVHLVNRQYFYLSYTGMSWIAQVEGRKYYLEKLNDRQRACEAISNILKVGPVMTGTDLFDKESEQERSLNSNYGSSGSSGGSDMEDLLDTEPPESEDESEVDYSEFTDEE